MIATERMYPIRRPLAAFTAGAAVALLGGLIGLGGAEFRLPLLIGVFALFAHRAVRINLLVSLATLATSAVARLGFLGSTKANAYTVEIACLLVGGIIAAWIGAGLLARIPKANIMSVIAALLLATAGLLAAEAMWSGADWSALAPGSPIRPVAALVAGTIGGGHQQPARRGRRRVPYSDPNFHLRRRHQDSRHRQRSDQYPHCPGRRGATLAYRALPVANDAHLSGAADGNWIDDRGRGGRLSGRLGRQRMRCACCWLRSLRRRRSSCGRTPRR